MEPLLGENPAITAIMEDVAHIKGRAVCLHVDVRRVPTRLTFHEDVRGGGDAGAPGAKDRERAGEQLAVQRVEAQKREEVCAETVGQKCWQPENGSTSRDELKSSLAEATRLKRRQEHDEAERYSVPDEELRTKKRKKKGYRQKKCMRLLKEGSCSVENCPYLHERFTAWGE